MSALISGLLDIEDAVLEDVTSMRHRLRNMEAIIGDEVTAIIHCMDEMEEGQAFVSQKLSAAL